MEAAPRAMVRRTVLINITEEVPLATMMLGAGRLREVYELLQAALTMGEARSLLIKHGGLLRVLDPVTVMHMATLPGIMGTLTSLVFPEEPLILIPLRCCHNHR